MNLAALRIFMFYEKLYKEVDGIITGNSLS